MAQVFSGRNVNELFPQVLQEIAEQSPYPSRNGPVLKFETPTLITYERPQERILFSHVRDANPFFHFFETLWMLDGRDDLGFLLPFNPRMAEYSDDGKLVRGSAYGVRWRRWFGVDQLRNIVVRLRSDPYDRRTVLSMWDGHEDLTIISKDVPCNTHCYFNYIPGVKIGMLDLTVCNRSNDLIYGCMGSNVFHFSFLLEYMAGMCGMEIGHYHQFTNNLHIYTENPTAKKCLENVKAISEEAKKHYPEEHFPLFTRGLDPSGWNSELNFFLRTGSIDDFIYHHEFFPRVAYPLWHAHKAWKDATASKDSLGVLSRYARAIGWTIQCDDGPLRQACLDWLVRRKTAALKKYSG
jgi:hypothetical protein